MDAELPGDEKPLPVASLNALAFIAGYDKHIYTQDDLLVVAKHIFGKAESETLSRLSCMIVDRQKTLLGLDWKYRILEKAAGDVCLTAFINRSIFIPRAEDQGGLFASRDFLYRNVTIKCDEYSIKFWGNSSINIFRPVASKKELCWTIEGTPADYRFLDDEDKVIAQNLILIPPELLNYIVFLWNYINETFPDNGVNYDGLEDLSGDEEQIDVEERLADAFFHVFDLNVEE